MARSTRRNTVMGNSQRNLDKEFPATGPTTRKKPLSELKPKTTARERASRPAYAENTNTLRVMRNKKRKS